ncbi:hypothetical protein F5879DRAFT_345402 [Lentinula edodes]|nr:hypothetical protein F5879DRAFT_345402 [Lentinula edodes]
MYFHPRRSGTAGCLPFKVCFVLILGLVSLVCIAALPIVSTDELDDPESHPHLARRDIYISWDVEVKYMYCDAQHQSETPRTIRKHIEDEIRSHVSPHDTISIKFASNGIPELVDDKIEFYITWISRTMAHGRTLVGGERGPATTGGYIHFVGNESPTLYVVKIRPPVKWRVNVIFEGDRARGFLKAQTEHVKKVVEKAIRDDIAQLCEVDTVQSVSFPEQWLSSYDQEVKMHFHIDRNDETRSTGYVQYTASEDQPYVVHFNRDYVSIAEHGSVSTSASRIPQINVIEASPPIPGQCVLPQFKHQRRTLG